MNDCLVNLAETFNCDNVFGVCKYGNKGYRLYAIRGNGDKPILSSAWLFDVTAE